MKMNVHSISLALLCALPLLATPAVVGASSGSIHENKPSRSSLRGMINSAARRFLLGGSEECYPAEGWKEVNQLFTGTMWDTVKASQQLVGVAIDAHHDGRPFSSLTTEWIPFLPTILDPKAGADLILSFAANTELFCAPEHNEAFALYAKSCASFSAYMDPLLQMVQKWIENATTNNAELEVIIHASNETLSYDTEDPYLEEEQEILAQFIVAEAKYHCERHLLFRQNIPIVAEQKTQSLMDKHDALVYLKSLIPMYANVTNSSMACFDELFTVN